MAATRCGQQRVLLRINFIFFTLSSTSVIMTKTAATGLQNVVLFGATGQTGQAFVELLCGGNRSHNFCATGALFNTIEGSREDPVSRQLTAITRRDFDWGLSETNPTPFGKFKLNVVKIDFENIPKMLGPVLKELAEKRPVDVAFCAHGTTRSAAGSADEFVRIDKNYTVEMARQCKAAGVKHFSLVSATTANPASMLLYPRTKGETIAEIKAIGFERFSVFKPGMLVTPKREDARVVEGFLQSMDPLLSWIGRRTGVKSLEGIKVEDLAAAMITNAMTPTNDSYQDFDTAPHIIALQPS